MGVNRILFGKMAVVSILILVLIIIILFRDSLREYINRNILVQKAVEYNETDFSRGIYLCKTTATTGPPWALILPDHTEELIIVKGNNPTNVLVPEIFIMGSQFLFEGALSDNKEIYSTDISEKYRTLFVDQWHIIKPIQRDVPFIDYYPTTYLVLRDYKSLARTGSDTQTQNIQRH